MNDQTRQTASTDLRRVGVVGAGVIGSGVAQALAQTSHEVVLVDVSDDVLGRVRTNLARSIRLHHLLDRDAVQLDVSEVLDRIHTTTDYEALADVDFVVENAVENVDVKFEIFKRLDGICREDCRFAANTSAIPITRIAAATARPAHVIGIHFMNPVPLKPAAEVIRGHHTSDETLARAIELLSQMGIAPIMVGDSPGFVSNRVLMLTVNEAAFLVHEGVASAEDVDDVFRQCFGHPMGPLETADLIGIDTVLLSIDVLHDEFGDSKYRPCPLLRTMVAAGLLGKKSGQGFHVYPTGSRKEPAVVR